MFSEILKIVPKLDNRDLQTMERGLNKRFKRVAKKFGKGIGAIFKGGGLLAIGLAFMDKILNPLKEVQDAINKTLVSTDDLATFANQFETTTGKLAKLSTLGKGSGLTENDLFYLLTKFQGSLAAERAGTEKNGLGEFTGFEDTTDAFFSFIQSLKQAPKDQQVLVQEKVFGERQILKMADFLQNDFKNVFEAGLNDVKSSDISKSYNRAAGLNDYRDGKEAVLDLKHQMRISNKINKGIVDEMLNAKRIEQRRLEQRVNAYKDLQAISNTTAKMLELLESSVVWIGKGLRELTVQIDKLVNFTSSLKNSSWFRGIIKYLPGGR